MSNMIEGVTTPEEIANGAVVKDSKYSVAYKYVADCVKQLSFANSYRKGKRSFIFELRNQRTESVQYNNMPRKVLSKLSYSKIYNTPTVESKYKDYSKILPLYNFAKNLCIQGSHIVIDDNMKSLLEDLHCASTTRLRSIKNMLSDRIKLVEDSNNAARAAVQKWYNSMDRLTGKPKPSEEVPYPNDRLEKTYAYIMIEIINYLLNQRQVQFEAVGIDYKCSSSFVADQSIDNEDDILHCTDDIFNDIREEVRYYQSIARRNLKICYLDTKFKRDSLVTGNMPYYGVYSNTDNDNDSSTTNNTNTSNTNQRITMNALPMLPAKDICRRPNGDMMPEFDDYYFEPSDEEDNNDSDDNDFDDYDNEDDSDDGISYETVYCDLYGKYSMCQKGDVYYNKDLKLLCDAHSGLPVDMDFFDEELPCTLLKDGQSMSVLPDGTVLVDMRCVGRLNKESLKTFRAHRGLYPSDQIDEGDYICNPCYIDALASMAYDMISTNSYYITVDGTTINNGTDLFEALFAPCTKFTKESSIIFNKYSNKKMCGRAA